MTSLTNKVALVTGASRGVGKGIALSLASAGATVYITGRTTEQGKSDSGLSGTINQTQQEITDKGGMCTALKCDHSDDAQVTQVFDYIHSKHSHIDILVNNVWGGYEHFTNGTEFWRETGFWDAPIARWDSMFACGVRAHYVAATKAAPPMIQQRKGLIINLSFYAASRNDQGVAYCTSKAASDRMSASMAFELAPHKVTVLSLFPGLVTTESVLAGADFIDLSNAESPEFVGRAVVALASDENVYQKSGGIVKTEQLAREYGFTDIDGKIPQPFTF